MKKIKILALLAVVMFIVQDLTDMTRGFSDGWRDAKEGTEFGGMPSTLFVVRPTEALVPDTLQGRVSGVKVPFWATQVEAQGKVDPSVAMKVTMLVLIPVAPLMFYGIYCLIRLIVSVVRGSVFTRKNVRRMRFFVYSIMLAGVVAELFGWFSYQNAVEHVLLPGYELVYSGLKYEWVAYFLLALFTEIFAIGKISLGELAEKIDLTPANLSILKTGKAKAVRFSTLEAICRVLDCQPGDLLEYREE